MITATGTSLLLGLRDARDDQVWGEFYSRYQPLLVSFGRRLGLKEDQAHDAAQEALMTFAKSYRQGRYDREKGRLRTWLMAIAANKIRDVQRRLHKESVLQGMASQTDLIALVADDHTISELWEREWREAILKACMEEVRQHVKPVAMQAFELVVLQGWPAENVVAQLGISRGQLYTYKCRILKRLQDVRAHLEENW